MPKSQPGPGQIFIRFQLPNLDHLRPPGQPTLSEKIAQRIVSAIVNSPGWNTNHFETLHPYNMSLSTDIQRNGSMYGKAAYGLTVVIHKKDSNDPVVWNSDRETNRKIVSILLESTGLRNVTSSTLETVASKTALEIQAGEPSRQHTAWMSGR